MFHKKKSPARGIPVRVTNRSNNSEGAVNGNSQPTANDNNVTINRQNTTSGKKTLLIGDSILNPVNTRGLITGIQKHSKSGAKVRNIVDDISLYNMKSFKSVVLYIGGNDSSSGTDTKLFEEKYDELVSLVKTSNPECQVYICYISIRGYVYIDMLYIDTIRGDTNVKTYTDCIQRVAEHWANHGVTLISESVNYFYGRDGEPTTRYYGNDGIHLSKSGIKRLLHAINVHIQLVDDFDQCVYKPRGNRNTADSAPGRFQHTFKLAEGSLLVLDITIIQVGTDSDGVLPVE